MGYRIFGKAKIMTKVLIFGGTVEGRELAEYGVQKGLTVAVSVVSEYGQGMLKAREGLSVRQGVLDQKGMAGWIQAENPILVMDATHPHATTATEHIFSACETAGVPCVRVLRQETEESFYTCGQDDGQVFWVDTPMEAMELLKRDKEPVLLTTGSRELEVFAAAGHLKGRIYARVLPDSQVIAACEMLGISGRQLIAMQGPFSVEMNCALIHATKTKWLVTKESGHPGGFAEKMEAAKACKVRTIVIRRPRQKAGLNLEESKEMLWKLAEDMVQREEEKLKQKEGRQEEQGELVKDIDQKEKAEWEQKGEGKENGQKGCRQLYLIGMGMGGGRQLTLEGIKALKQCPIIFGAPRMLQDVKEWTGKSKKVPVYSGEDIKSWLMAHPQVKTAAVVYSGDTGFYSGCRQMGETWGQDRGDYKVKVLPGISSMSCLCARLKRSWEDLYPASLHGKDCDIEGILHEHRQVFLLLGEKDGLGKLCRRLVLSGMGSVRVAAGIRMGYPDEQIVTGTGSELADWQGDGLASVILEWMEH